MIKPIIAAVSCLITLICFVVFIAVVIPRPGPINPLVLLFFAYLSFGIGMLALRELVRWESRSCRREDSELD